MYRKYLLDIEQKQNAETASMRAIPEKYRFANKKTKNKKKMKKYIRTRNYIIDIIKHHNPTGIDIHKIRVHACV